MERLIISIKGLGCVYHASTVYLIPLALKPKALQEHLLTSQISILFLRSDSNTHIQYRGILQPHIYIPRYTNRHGAFKHTVERRDSRSPSAVKGLLVRQEMAVWQHPHLDTSQKSTIFLTGQSVYNHLEPQIVNRILRCPNNISLCIHRCI